MSGYVTVTTAPTATALCTLAAVKADLGISVATYDAILTRLIDAASAAIVQYLGYPLARATYEEAVPGYGDNILELSRTPLNGDPDSVVLDSSPVIGWTVGDADAGHLLLETGWDWTAVVGWDRSPHLRNDNPAFVVTYTAGYLTPDHDDYASPGTDDHLLPAQIEEAAIITVRHWYRARSAPAANVSSKAVGDLKVTYSSTETVGAGGLPPAAIALLPQRIWSGS
jgi:hypothetical protein